MRLEHHLVGGYVRYISPHIIIIIIMIFVLCQPWHLLCLTMVTKTNFRPSGMRTSWLYFV